MEKAKHYFNAIIVNRCERLKSLKNSFKVQRKIKNKVSILKIKVGKVLNKT